MHWTSLTLGFFCTPNVLTKNDLLYNLICLWHFSIKSTVFYLELRCNVFDQLKAKAFRNAISHNALTLQTYNKHTKHILSFDMLKRTLQVQCNMSASTIGHNCACLIIIIIKRQVNSSVLQGPGSCCTEIVYFLWLFFFSFKTHGPVNQQNITSV